MKKMRYSALIVIAFAFFLLLSEETKAQHTDVVDSSQKQVFADTSKSYVAPDIMKKPKRWTLFHTKWFDGKIGLGPIIDYDAFILNKEAKEQVGKQDNLFDLRSGRVLATGKILFKHPWTYLVSVEYKGFDRTKDEKNFGVMDVKFIIPVFRSWNLTVGKIKETFVYEMVADGANLPHQERILNSFFRNRNIGATFGRTLVNDRVTVVAGWYNDWLFEGQRFNESANTFTARITGLPKYELNGKLFMHLGAAYRYLEAEKGVLRLKGQNESNVAAYYVDTKDFPASYIQHVAFEQLWSLENFSVLNEVVQSWAKTPTGIEQFNGIYVTASYVISGEQRPYDKKAAYARRVKPDGRGGAQELVFRVARVDLATHNIDGGILNKYSFGVNWWATQYWKAGFYYGVANLHREGIIGVTHSFQTRLQWIY